MTDLPIRKRKQFTFTKRHLVAFSITTAAISVLTGAIGYQTGKKLHASNSSQVQNLTYALLPDGEKQRALEELLLEIEHTQANAADSDYKFPSEIIKDEPLDIPVEVLPPTQETTIPASEEDSPTPELPTTPLPTTGWSVQVGSYPNLEEAQARLELLAAENSNGYIVTASVNGENWYRVRISGYATKALAIDAKKALQIKNQEFDYFIYKSP